MPCSNLPTFFSFRHPQRFFSSLPSARTTSKGGWRPVASVEPAPAMPHGSGRRLRPCPRRGLFPFGHGGASPSTAHVLRPTPRHADARRIERNGAARDGGAALPEVRLFNFGIGVHLLQAEDPEGMPPKKTEIDPKDNHISFTCDSLEVVQRRLKEMGINYVHRRVEEGGIYVDQLFFHDPDSFMIEVCTCDNLPIIPVVPAPLCNRAVPKTAPVKASGGGGCVGEAVDVPAAACAMVACPEQAYIQA